MTIDIGTGEEFTCASGRDATFGGRWLVPCRAKTSPNRHRLFTAVGTWDFCEYHMQEIIAAGLVSDPYISAEGARHLVHSERQGLGLL